jgi:hypothetical protein
LSGFVWLLEGGQEREEKLPRPRSLENDSNNIIAVETELIIFFFFDMFGLVPYNTHIFPSQFLTRYMNERWILKWITRSTNLVEWGRVKHLIRNMELAFCLNCDDWIHNKEAVFDLNGDLRRDV